MSARHDELWADDIATQSTPQPHVIFVDTSALYAVIDADDAVHAEAATVFRRLLGDGATLPLAIALGGHAWERAGRIWFDALTKAAKPHRTFRHFASETIAAANHRFGADVAREVIAAWCAVGVPA